MKAERSTFERRLPNGARLVVVPSERGPVAIQLWILAGTAAERGAEHGCAHLLEHMLFKPTSGAGGNGHEFDIASAIEALAGDVNAFTSHDETVFHATVPSAAVGDAMEALIGAVAHPRLDPEQLRREASVVVEEIRQADEDAAGRVGQELLELLYRGHAYGRPVLGEKREVLSHRVSRLNRVHRELYTADRSVLVVAGPVDTASVVRRAKRLLGALPRRGRAVALREPKLPHAPRIRVRAATVHEANLAIGWAAPPLTQAADEAACALEVASVVLGYGEASRLQERVRRGAGLATDAYASFYASRVSSALAVTVNTTGPSAAAAAAAVLDEVDALRFVPITPAELQRAQAVVRSEIVYRQETASGRAHALGYQLSLSGDLKSERRYFEAIDALTPQVIQRVCAKYLDPARASASVAVPKHRAQHERAVRATLKARLQRAKRGRAKPKIVRGRGGIASVDFRCGFRLRARADKSVPMATGWLVWPGGLRAEKERDLGASSMIATLLTRGSANATGDTLAREVDGMAAVLEGFSGRNSVGMHFECLADDVSVVARRALECAATPRFDEDELEEVRRIALEELAAEKDDVGGQVFAAAYRELYRGHPFRWRRGGSAQSLKRMTSERLRTLWARGYPLSRAVLGVAGDVDLPALVDLLEYLLPDAPGPTGVAWQNGAPKYPRRPLSKSIGGAREQAHVVRVYPGLTLADERVYALQVLCAVLSGQAGRLFESLREEKGLVYHASGGASEGVDAGHVSLYAATRHGARDEALAALQHEVDALIDVPVGRNELATAKAWLCGQFEAETQRRSRVASALAFDEAYGLGTHAWLSFPRKIRAVTAGDVLAIAREIFDPRTAVTVVTRRPR